MSVRFCKTCQVDHPYDEFKCNKHGVPNTHHCSKSVNKRRTRKGDLQKDYNLKQKYGISLEDFNLMKQSQNNSCKICRKDKPLIVDHCHETGKIRGLLCSRCNSSIGLVDENIETLESAIEYLKSSK